MVPVKTSALFLRDIIEQFLFEDDLKGTLGKKGHIFNHLSESNEATRPVLSWNYLEHPGETSARTSLLHHM